MESILITGAAGFIGLNMVKYQFNEGNHIYAMVLPYDIEGINKIKKISKEINIITETVNEMIMNKEVYPCFDKIYHFATVGVNPEFSDINLICDVNIKMTCELIKFAKLNNTGLFINVGSCFEYGRNEAKLLEEDDYCYPESLYAISKHASVNMAIAYAKTSNVKLITVRPFGVFGSGENENRLAPLIIKHGLEGKTLNLTGGEQIRDFVNVKDVVTCISLLASSKQITYYEIYNICSNNPLSVKEFAKEIISYLKLDRNLFHFGTIPYRKNESMYFAGNNKKIKNIINYNFPTNHYNGIQDLYNEITEEMRKKHDN